ncbi:MAG: hypothetical protein WDM70_09165 [Nitrosomonadales bacterium]
MKAPQGCSTGFQGWWNRKRSTLRSPHSHFNPELQQDVEWKPRQGCSTGFSRMVEAQAFHPTKPMFQI